MPVVLALGENDERIIERLLPEGRRPAIIVRLIRYEPGPNSGTKAHHDKSGLSVILDSDDPDEDYFVLGRYGSSSMAELHRPYRHQASRGAWTSAIVFPGLCFQEAGFSWIKPTVHAVRPFSEERQRHAVVGFLLVPYLDMKHLQTTLDFRD